MNNIFRCRGCHTSTNEISITDDDTIFTVLCICIFPSSILRINAFRENSIFISSLIVVFLFMTWRLNPSMDKPDLIASSRMESAVLNAREMAFISFIRSSS
jgi:hypothetical protein